MRCARNSRLSEGSQSGTALVAFSFGTAPVEDRSGRVQLDEQCTFAGMDVPDEDRIEIMIIT